MSRQSILLLATRNRGKLRELAALLSDLPLELRGLDAFPDAPVVAETGDTYLVNARLKANAIAQHTQLPTLADDSGLEVDALHGAPGVLSARFAGDHASDADNIALLLQRLHAVPRPERTARFRAVIVAVHPDGREVSSEGICEGIIEDQPSGSGGFGYDPVFYFPPLQRTFAQLDQTTKNGISHRTDACRRVKPLLHTLLD